ncbi:MAG: hypothetical protein EOO92_03720 [Pedobacter sp.]|nr:MAG: hypothetical protein EOO92_03720 [Pedobacter sp.]
MKKLSLFLLAATLLISCDKEETEQDCAADVVCDASFAMISIQFVDKDNKGIEIKDYSAINQRTKDSVHSASSATINTTPGTFIVVDDANRSKLSTSGDEIKVSGTNPLTNQTKSATIKVAGGKCACHVTKISGADKITFD